MRLVLDPAFPARLRELRQQAGLSLRALAAATMSSKSHIQEFETGIKVPSRETLALLDQAVRADGTLEAMVISLEPRWEEPALPIQPSRDVVAVARLRTARLRRLDNHLGGADTYSLYAAELDTTTAAVRAGGGSETTDRGLLSVMAEQAQMAGFSAFDAGWFHDAERLYRLSLSAARDAGDMSLVANALTLLGYQAIARGGSGVNLSTTSCDLTASATPGVRALMHERCAWACASAGRAEDTDRHLGLAAEAVHDPARAGDPDWVWWVDPTEVQIMTGRCWSLLHRPMRAIPTLEQALAGYSDTHARDKALYLTFLARAYLDANEIEQACAVARRAVELAYGVTSTRPRQSVAAFVAELDPNQPAASELRDLVREWVSQPLPAAPSRSIEPTPPPALLR